jgi:hypothetical protein
VHALFQPARNLVFGFDFSATAFMGSKGLAQPSHQYCRSQALEQGVRDCTLVGGGALLLRHSPRHTERKSTTREFPSLRVVQYVSDT